MTRRNKDLFRTDLMALVAYLRYVGHVPVECYFNLDRDRCVWVFRDAEDLQKDVVAFRKDEVLVRPRDYSRAFAQAKRDMYDARNSVESTAGDVREEEH